MKYNNDIRNPELKQLNSNPWIWFGPLYCTQMSKTRQQPTTNVSLQNSKCDQEITSLDMDRAPPGWLCCWCECTQRCRSNKGAPHFNDVQVLSQSITTISWSNSELVMVPLCRYQPLAVRHSIISLSLSFFSNRQSRNKNIIMLSWRARALIHQLLPICWSWLVGTSLLPSSGNVIISEAAEKQNK